MRYTVEFKTDPLPGTTLGAAEHQGYGPEALLAYLERIIPAGSPVRVLKADAIAGSALTAAQSPTQEPASSGPGTRCECGAGWDEESGGYRCAR